MLVTQVKKKNEVRIVPVKCSPDVIEQLQSQADKYTEGNLSEWLRYAGLNCIPKKSDIIQSKKQNKK